ncbi:MAG TPA: DUF1398 family protein [Candidatus Paceibacterota bacterium]
MFTIEQIKERHAKVKSGADFPSYVRELATLGIIRYDLFVSDGHSEYYGKDGSVLHSDAKYSPIDIEEESDAEEFKEYLRMHQEGQIDFPAFCMRAAETGVFKWTVDIASMTCTYYDRDEVKMLVELIP